MPIDSARPDPDVDRLVLADSFLKYRHLPLFELADQPMVGILLGNAAYQGLADPLQFGLGLPASFHAQASKRPGRRG